MSPHLPPDQAANALLPAQLGTWQAARGHAVTFITQRAPSGRRSPSVDLPGKVYRARPRSRSKWKRFLRIDALRRSTSIVETLSEAATNADLIHLHSNGLLIETAAAWGGHREIPCVLTLYGTEIWHYRKRWPVDLFTRAYRRAQAVTFYSRGLHDKAIELGLGRLRASVVYPAVSKTFQPVAPVTREAWRRELGIHEPHVVLNVKRLHPLAGQRYLIDAFAQIARDRDDVRLVICGEGRLRTDLEAHATALGLTSKVTFAGLVPNDQIARYAAVADVFALPSLLEALPTVAVEALAATTPVVSADHPGGVELHGLFGDDVSLVPRENASALADALREALDHPRRTTPKTAEIIANTFSPEAVEQAYAEVYELALR